MPGRRPRAGEPRERHGFPRSGGRRASRGPHVAVSVSPRWLAWHTFAVAAFWGMFWLGDWQLHRALAGNALSWAYTFEWPIFALMGAVFWAKTIRDEFRIRRGEVAPHDAPVLPGGAFGPGRGRPGRDYYGG